MIEQIAARILCPLSTDSKTRDVTELGYGTLHGSSAKPEHIETHGYVLDYVDLAPDVAEAVKKEADAWVLEDQYSYFYENDDTGATRFSDSVTYHEIADIASISSPVFSGPRGDILVMDGHFAGVVLKIESSGGNGWAGSRSVMYSILFVDGTVLGSNVNSERFSGSDSTSSKSNSYYLKKKDELPK